MIYATVSSQAVFFWVVDGIHTYDDYWTGTGTIIPNLEKF